MAEGNKQIVEASNSAPAHGGLQSRIADFFDAVRAAQHVGAGRLHLLSASNAADFAKESEAESLAFGGKGGAARQQNLSDTADVGNTQRFVPHIEGFFLKC